MAKPSPTAERIGSTPRISSNCAALNPPGRSLLQVETW